MQVAVVQETTEIAPDLSLEREIEVVQEISFHNIIPETVDLRADLQVVLVLQEMIEAVLPVEEDP